MSNKLISTETHHIKTDHSMAFLFNGIEYSASVSVNNMVDCDHTSVVIGSIETADEHLEVMGGQVMDYALKLARQQFSC